MNTSNRGLFVFVHGLALVVFLGFAIVALVIGNAYFAKTFPGAGHIWLVAYLPLAPFIARYGWRDFSPRRSGSWILALAPVLWILPIYLMRG